MFDAHDGASLDVDRIGILRDVIRRDQCWSIGH